MKRCPKCGSSRLRRGYVDTPLPLRLVGYREILCNGCNLRFNSFALPGTIPANTRNGKSEKEQKDIRTNAERGQVSSPTQRIEEDLNSPSRGGTARACVKCGSRDVRRSHKRNLFEKALSLFSIRPLRCMECQNRFYLFGHGS